MHFDQRKSGLELIGDLPWGSHICQFYETKEDLLEVLVPYFKAGMESNEACLWLASGPLGAAEARQALRRALPRFDGCVASGQLEVAGADAAAPDLAVRLDQAVSRGFDGLRLARHSLPADEVGWSWPQGARNLIAATVYPRSGCDALRLMEVVKCHRCALLRNAGRWEVVESSEARTVRDALQRGEARLQSVFANMSEGFAYHRIVLDGQGRPCDYVFLEANAAFERLTGLRSDDICGRRVTQVLPGIEKDSADWIGRYGAVALTGKPEQFESHSQALGKWFVISAFSPCQGFFAVTFSDITERKRAEAALHDHAEELRASNEELERFNRAMADRELRMIELKKQVNELRVRLGEPPLYSLDFEKEGL